MLRGGGRTGLDLIASKRRGLVLSMWRGVGGSVFGRKGGMRSCFHRRNKEGDKRLSYGKRKGEQTLYKVMKQGWIHISAKKQGENNKPVSSLCKRSREENNSALSP